MELTLTILGAGNRGMHAYSEIAKRADIPFKIIAVADPDERRCRKMQQEHGISESNIFMEWKEALAGPRLSDAVIVATPDNEHVECAIAALKKGYHVLLEKPMARTAEDCNKIISAQEESGKVLLVAHVLRYTRFFSKLKDIISSGKLGQIVDMNLSENICYWHFAHSYVRGNWRRTSDSGPLVLTKSCHDIDILSWLMEADVESVYSTGALNFFNKDNAPEGSAPSCTDECRVKGRCIFDADKIYLSKEIIDWPANVVSPTDTTLEGVKKALKTSQYGRCVFNCDNDVCDTQNVTLAFNGNKFATLQINGHSADFTRKIQVNCTHGQVTGDLYANSMRITTKTGNLKQGDLQEEESFDMGTGKHAGGDYFLMKEFADAILDDKTDLNHTTARNSLMSHIIAFAAEESRKTGNPIHPRYIDTNIPCIPKKEI
ncbi:MAG: Gfo/Idh/MocA family oxidoreductase [Candidatus Woesearchaeota archaeon]